MAAVAGVLAMSGIQAGAVPFDPLFRVTEISGECLVQPPDADQFAPAVEGKAYNYGTKLKTGRKSSAVINFSEGNTARVLAGASMTVTKDVKDAKLKVIKLDLGKLEVSLDEAFGKEKIDALNIETPTAICAAIGCKYTVEAKLEAGEEGVMLNSVLMVCKEGKIKVFGPHYDITELDTDDWVLVSGSRDKSFLRVKCVKGTFEMLLTDSEGKPKTISLKTGAVVKIWWAKSETGNAMIVTILIGAPDGTTEETIVYSEEIGAGGEAGKGEQGREGKGEEQAGEEKVTRRERQPDDSDKWPEISITNRPRFTPPTTTTTIPSPTPVGKR